MKKEDLDKLEEEISALSDDELKLRDVYLRKIASGEMYGPLVGYPNIDKPWLQWFDEDFLLKKVNKTSIYENLKILNKKNMKKTAISYFGRKYTYKNLIEKIDKLAASFANLGLKKGDIVTLALPNIPENVFIFYALNKIGAIANFIDLRLKDENLINAINVTGSKMIFVCDMFLNNFYEVKERTSIKTAIIVSPGNSLPTLIKPLYEMKQEKYELKHGTMTYKEFESFSSKSTHIDYIPNEDDPICILHTSGTTGLPKGVVLTNKAFNEMALQVRYGGLKYSKNDKFLNQVPPFLAYNILAAVNNPLQAGLEIVMLPDYKPEEFAKNIIKHKPQHAIAGPADWSNFLDNEKKLDKKNVDLSFLVSMISGSDKIDEVKKEKINEFFKRHNCNEKILEGYGLTEIGAAAVMNVPQRNVLGSVGIPLRSVNICIYDNDNECELSYNQEGEICLSSDTEMKEYFNNEVATENMKRLHKDGKYYLHTGDLGYVDKSGNLYLKGRIKRVIIRHDGIKINPYMLEDIITEIPEIKNCCVVGVTNREMGYGSLPMVNVSLKEGINISDEDIINKIKTICESKLSQKYLPYDYKIWDELPLTEVGKVDFRKITKINEEELDTKTLKLQK